MLINRNDIYDKNLNFLIGSGASVGILPTLALSLNKFGTNEPHTLETLATKFEGDDALMCLIFSYYVENVIAPAAFFNVEAPTEKQKTVLRNYVRFLESTLIFLSKNSSSKAANIFTTNYDGLVAHCAEKMVRSGRFDFVMNDGAVGFMKRTLQTRSFNRLVKDRGTFSHHEIVVPQINLWQPHGSVYWYKDNEDIEVSYDLQRSSDRIGAVPTWMAATFEEIVTDKTKTDRDLEAEGFSVPQEDRDAFWREYEKLPVVNPTKWKFHETVFEEHYYQSLRGLSYELEKPNTVFIVFGFSFADEHILSLVKRSLSNPKLKVFICCYSDAVKRSLEAKFGGFDNIELILTEDPLDFTVFNNEVFSANPPADVDA